MKGNKEAQWAGLVMGWFGVNVTCVFFSRSHFSLSAAAAGGDKQGSWTGLAFSALFSALANGLP